MIKKIFNWFLMWVFVIAMAVNVGTATYTILRASLDNNSLIYAGKLIDSAKNQVEKQGSIIYEAGDIKVMIFTNEWHEQHGGSNG